MNKTNLTQQFEYMFEKNSCVGEYGIESSIGWNNLIFHLLIIIAQLDTFKYLRIHQIKSKFAGLRFYTSWAGPARKPTIRDRIVDIMYHIPWKLRKILLSIGLPTHKKWDPTYDKINEIIQTFENASYQVCEYCGEVGTSRITKHRWFFTLCDKCWAEKESMESFGDMLREENLLGSGHLQPQDL